MKLLWIMLGLLTGVALGAADVPRETATQGEKSMKNQAEIYLAGGCYWGTQHFLKQIFGVYETEVGFANGNVDSPTYEQVCKGNTGFAETVRVVYDKDRIALPQILELYAKTIDPTVLNRQGNDIGAQYRTGIYYTNPEDKTVIEAFLKELATHYPQKLAVEILPLKNFFPADATHQNYLDQNPQGYCHIDPALFELARKANRPEKAKYVKKAIAELKKLLTPIQFDVTQKNDTEPPFQNPYWDEKRVGIYVDITTGEPLFLSTDKFDSGCGWPSFSKPIAEDLIDERKDTTLSRVRTEVRSVTGDAHLGHVFTDGPKDKGGLRYCINSAAIRFIPKEKMDAEGYGDYVKLLP